MKIRGRFRFSLDTVLRVRTLREEQARLELARIIMRLECARQTLKDTELLLVQYQAALQSSTAQAMAGKEFQLHAAYINYLRDALQGWKGRLAQEEAEVRRQKLKLQHLHQEQRLLEDLRERKLSRFKREVARTLEKENEIGVLLRWGTK